MYQNDELSVPAGRIRPADYLPPQQALHGTRFQRDGFVVGSAPRDVTELAVRPVECCSSVRPGLSTRYR